MRIRQIALAATDLAPVLDDLKFVLGLGAPFADPGVAVFGLANGVFAIGEHFLEVVSPTQENTAAGRFLARRGDGGYMVIFQTRRITERRTHLAARGVRTVWEVSLPDIETIHLHPRDTGAAIVSIDEARPWESWRWGGPEWRSQVRTDRVAGIAGVEIECDDPSALAARWADLFELVPGTQADTLALDDGARIVFTDSTSGRGEGIRSILLRANDAAAVREAAIARGFAPDADGAIAVGGVKIVTE